MYEKRRSALHIYRSVQRFLCPWGGENSRHCFTFKVKVVGVIQANVPTVKNTAWRPQLGC